ncbi:CDAN1-interacting nuclease 1-like [Polyodon spathula]|uniref:CDAN1-interacting nuclease 1-like n=1 Tax=Polyodon spathula TaxID=7913 RepID=UPI001B7DF675|nr:CDAN1-interacting nuclease 1-like [Polyodon spathula]
MKLVRAEYQELAKYMEHLRPTRQCMKMLKEKFSSQSQSTLLSIFSQEYQKRIKRSHVRHLTEEAIENYCQKYDLPIPLEGTTGLNKWTTLKECKPG